MTNIERVDDDTGEIFEPATTDLSVVSAEINQQIMTSRRFPRRKDKVIALEIMSRAALNDEIATECIYNLKRGRGDDAKEIIGPSIRFAEIVRASYGNIRVASRFVRIDKDDPLRQAVIVEAIAMDMQQNDAEIIQVRRSIMTSPKQGQPRPYNADMTNMTINAGQSIARRNAILALVPKALWVDGYHNSLDVVRGTAATLNERRAKLITAFGTFGVKPQELFEALGIDSEQEITLNDMPGLAGMWTALREGEQIAVVLGRAREESGAGPVKTAVRSPLADDPPRGDAPPPAEVSRSTVERPAAETSRQDQQRQDPEKIKEAIQTVAKEQQSGQARTEPAGASKAEPAVKQRATPETAPATIPQSEKAHPEEDQSEPRMAPATAFLQEAMAVIENAVSETALKEWWKRTRPTRDKAGLSSLQISDLTEAKDDKLAALATRG